MQKVRYKEHMGRSRTVKSKQVGRHQECSCRGWASRSREKHFHRTAASPSYRDSVGRRASERSLDWDSGTDCM